MDDDKRDERLETEIFRKLTIPKLVVPRSFEPKLRELDLEGIEKRDRRTLMAVSVLEQKVDFAIQWIHTNNYWLRQIQAQQIRDTSRGIRVLRYLALILSAGAAGALMEELFKWLFR